MIKKIYFTYFILLAVTLSQAQSRRDSTARKIPPLEFGSNTTYSISYALPFPSLLANTSLCNQYSSSSGFASYNSKGFANSFSYNAGEKFYGADNYSSVFNAPLGELLFTPLDIGQIKISTNAESSVIGNSIYGLTRLTVQDPFSEQRLVVSQNNGFNSLYGLYNKTMLRYAQAYGERKNVALDISGEYTQKQEWHFDTDNTNVYANGIVSPNVSVLLREQQYRDVGPGFTQNDKDRVIKLNSWLDFNPIAAPGIIQVGIPGYSENDFVEKDFKNAKARAGLHFRLGRGIGLSTGYRFSLFNTIVQPFFRYQLKNYTVHQPQIELTGRYFSFRAYGTFENSGNSYNLDRTGYHFVTAIDGPYVVNYSWNYLHKYFDKIDTLTGFCTDCITWDDITQARNAAVTYAAQTPYPQKGSTAFDTSFKSITTDIHPETGSAWRSISKTFNAEGEYRFGFLYWMDIAIGANYQLISLQNNEWHTGGKLFHNAAVNLKLAKSFWRDRFKVFASGRFNYNTDFGPRGDYNAGVSFSMNNQSITVSSGSGYTLPTLAQRYMRIHDFYEFFDGNKFDQDIWYTYAALQKFKTVQALHDIDSAFNYLNNMEIFKVTPLKPQEIKTIEFSLKNTIAGRIVITTHAYFNWIQNTQALAHLVSPIHDTLVTGYVGHGNTPKEQQGIDIFLAGVPYTSFFTWTNLPVKTNSWGAYINIRYMGWHGINPYVNYHYFGHKQIVVNDEAIVGFNDFNTPEHKVNVGVSAEDVWKGFGFGINFKWVSTYTWQTDFAKGNVPAYHTLDITLQYTMPKIYSTITIGATNIYNNRHTEIPGSPRMGAWYYAGWRVDLGLKKRDD